MRRTAVLLTVVLAAAVPDPGLAASRTSASLYPETVAVVEGHTRYSCFGCGHTVASFVGTVVHGTGLLPTDAVVSIDAIANLPAVTCPAAETLSGDMLVDGEPYTDVIWSRLGATAIVHLSNGGSGTAVSEVGAGRCGASNSQVATVLTLTAQRGDPEGSAVIPTGACLVVDDPAVGEGMCAGGLSGVVVDALSGEITVGEDVLRHRLKTSHRFYTIGIGYSGRSLNGNTKLLFVTTNSRGCSGGAEFRFNTIASGWDNRIRSGRMGNGCRAFFYENQYLTGSSRQCVDVCRNITEGVSSVLFLR